MAALSKLLRVSIRFILLGLLTFAAVPTGVSRVFAASEAVLWSFGNGDDGKDPQAGLLLLNGNLYGTTVSGGLYGQGTVFELKPPTVIGGSVTESVVWSFGAGADGAQPYGGLVADRQGNLFGTTASGGTNGKCGDPAGAPNNCGTVFKLTPPSASNGSWTESVLWNFGSNSDGYFPYAGLIVDRSGNLYGTTESGGVKQNADGRTHGTVFKLTPSSTTGGNWTESILWNFGNGGSDGIYPYYANLLMDASGNLYGTTLLSLVGGIPYDGTVFQLAPPSTSGGSWSESILYRFCTEPLCSDGSSPYYSGLIMDASGNLYGTTLLGGAYDLGCCGGGGTVFELVPPATSGGNWAESVLHSFRIGDGAVPFAGLVMDASGNLYGTTGYGGAYTVFNRTDGYGTVFKVKPPTASGGSWTGGVLWSFDNDDGAVPQAPLIVGPAGVLYGASSSGGTYGGGTVFAISHTGIVGRAQR